MFDQSWRISFLAVEGLRDVELSERDFHLFVVWVIEPVNPRKNRASCELLYKSNRPQVSMSYSLINHLGWQEKNLQTTSHRRLVYEFFEFSTNIPSGLSAFI